MDYIFHLKDITDSTKRSSIMSFIKDAFKSQIWGFPGGSEVRDLPASAGDTGFTPSPGRSHRPQGD